MAKPPTGERFGRLVVVGVMSSETRPKWICQCDCGRSHIADAGNIRRGRTKSCGCTTKQAISAARRKDLSAQRFGRLVAITPDGNLRWHCRCDCGATTSVLTNSLARGWTTSCGCRRRDVSRSLNRTHGHTANRRNTATFSSWAHAKRRCYDTADVRYALYGGRGITMCERWRTDFSAFLADMGTRPMGTTLERKDRNGPYAPENCRWATYVEQASNTSKTIFITLADGRSVTLAAAAREFGVDYSSLHHRVRYKGQDPLSAIAEMQRR